MTLLRWKSALEGLDHGIAVYPVRMSAGFYWSSPDDTSWGLQGCFQVIYWLHPALTRMKQQASLQFQEPTSSFPNEVLSPVLGESSSFRIALHWIFSFSNGDSRGVSYYQYIFSYYGLSIILNFLYLTHGTYFLLGSISTDTDLVAYLNVWIFRTQP